MTFATRLRPREGAPGKHQRKITGAEGGARRRDTAVLLGGQFCSAGGTGGGTADSLLINVGNTMVSLNGTGQEDDGSTAAVPTANSGKPTSPQARADSSGSNIIDAGPDDQLADARLADTPRQGQSQSAQLPALSPEAEARAKENLDIILKKDSNYVNTLSADERLDILQYLQQTNNDGTQDPQISSDLKEALWAPIINDPNLNLTQALKGQEVIDKLQNLPAVQQIQNLCQNDQWASMPDDEKQRILSEVINPIADVYDLPHQYTVQIGGLSIPGTGAQYFPSNNTIAIEPGLAVTDYGANLFAILAHEMTHAWQDQYTADHINDAGTSGLLARVFSINNRADVYINSPFDQDYGQQPNEKQAFATQYYIMNRGQQLGYMGRIYAIPQRQRHD